MSKATVLPHILAALSDFDQPVAARVLTGRIQQHQPAIGYKSVIDALNKLRNRAAVHRIGSKHSARWSLGAPLEVVAMAELERLWHRGQTADQGGGRQSGDSNLSYQK